MFSARGAHVMYADRVGHELMQPGQTVHQEIVKRFGDSVVNPDGTIDRARLAEVAFGNDRLEELNSIIHPAVAERFQEWVSERNEFDPRSILIFEAALILEAGLGKYFDKLVVVTSSAQQKLDRFATRAIPGDSKDESLRGQALRDAERRIGSQLSQDEKVAAADYVIDNSGTLAETERQVNKIYRELQQIVTGVQRVSG
jgi:dephospho-CoA kinase